MPMTDYVLINRYMVNVTIGGMTKSYPQKKRGKRTTRSYLAYLFCQAQGWPVEQGEKWAVFKVKDVAKLPDLFELLEWFDPLAGENNHR
jgi:hypothetical protein